MVSAGRHAPREISVWEEVFMSASKDRQKQVDQLDRDERKQHAGNVVKQHAPALIQLAQKGERFGQATAGWLLSR